MTGSEFQAELTAAGYTQAEFARTVGVHRDTIGKKCHADYVDPSWGYMLAGLIAITNVKTLLSIAKKL